MVTSLHCHHDGACRAKLSPPARTVSPMTEEDRAIIRLASQTHRPQGELEAEARDAFGLSWVQFFARVNRLIDDPAAALAEPVRLGQLRRIRDGRLAQRRAC